MIKRFFLFIKVFYAVTILLLIAGCSMTIPSTVIYNLYLPNIHAQDTAKQESGAPQLAYELTIIVQSPNYLSQPYIAYRDSQYKVESSKYAKWDESPDKLVGEEFRYKISKMNVFERVNVTSGNMAKSYVLNIYLKRFERVDEGEAAFSECSYDFEISSPDSVRPLYTGSFYKKNKLADKSYLELAKGLSSALDEGIKEVQSHVIKI